MGRPTVITPNVVRLLIDSFHNGASIRDACLQSGISHEAYYQRLKSDRDFADKMEVARLMPSRKARMNIIKSINTGDLSSSKWWLDRHPSHEVIDTMHQNEQSLDGSKVIQSKSLVAFEYKSSKAIIISNYCIKNKLNVHVELNKLFALTEDQLFEAALYDAANGLLQTPNILNHIKLETEVKK